VNARVHARDTVEEMRGFALVSCLIAIQDLAQAASPPPTTQTPRPLAQAIDPAVDKWWSEAREPCRVPIKLGVPCFPVEVHAEGPSVSVRDSLWNLGPNGKPSEHRPPTTQEMQAVRPGPKSVPVPLVSFDPICAAKHALKAAKGKNDTYYLYRLRDASGEHVVLRDQKLEAKAYQGSAEFLGQFDGECAAIAAFRHEDRRDTITP
jgi:hypothetical protein